jgi:hypothetical protein
MMIATIMADMAAEMVQMVMRVSRLLLNGNLRILLIAFQIL